MNDNVHKTMPTSCPYCGEVNNRVTNAKGIGGPAPGDVTVCMACSNVAVFAEDLSTRKPLEGELEGLDTETTSGIAKAQEFVQLSKRGARMPTQLVKPILNINGTSREAMLESHINALEGLRQALHLLDETAPHPRDYPKSFDFATAHAQFHARRTKLLDIMRELQEIAESFTA